MAWRQRVVDENLYSCLWRPAACYYPHQPGGWTRKPPYAWQHTEYDRTAHLLRAMACWGVIAWLSLEAWPPSYPDFALVQAPQVVGMAHLRGQRARFFPAGLRIGPVSEGLIVKQH